MNPKVLDEILQKMHEPNLPFTKQLPEVDSIEVMRVSGDSTGIAEIFDSRILTETEAQTFVELWRAQNFDVWPSKCHIPAYAVAFYLDDKPYVLATICWQCDDIYLLQEKGLSTQGFQAQGKEGQELLAFFKQALLSE